MFLVKTAFIYQDVEIVVVSASIPGDMGSIPGRVIPNI